MNDSITITALLTIAVIAFVTKISENSVDYLKEKFKVIFIRKKKAMNMTAINLPADIQKKIEIEFLVKLPENSTLNDIAVNFKVGPANLTLMENYLNTYSILVSEHKLSCSKMNDNNNHNHFDKHFQDSQRIGEKMNRITAEIFHILRNR